jgi:hypothetical protein
MATPALREPWRLKGCVRFRSQTFFYNFFLATSALLAAMVFDVYLTQVLRMRASLVFNPSFKLQFLFDTHF